MNSLIHCVYSSAAHPIFKEHEIPAFLDKIRTANASQNITGMLLYIEGGFFQVLEGEPVAVDAVYRKIKADPRHERLTLIIREPILERSFGEWTMGFEALGLKEAGALIGENDFFTAASCVAKLTPGRAKKLLAAFRTGRWRAERTGRHRALGGSA